MRNFKAYQTDEKSRIIGIAYSGDQIKYHCWKDPVVIDMGNILLPSKVPLMFNNGEKNDLHIGTVTVNNFANAIFIDGIIDLKSLMINDIIKMLIDDEQLALNINVDVLECVFVQHDRMVNDMEQEAPFYHIQKSILREICISQLKNENEHTEVVRKNNIDEIPEIVREVISAGLTPESVTKKILGNTRTEHPNAGVTINIYSTLEGDERRKTIEAVMGLRCGLSSDILEKSYGARVVEAAMTEMDMPLKQFLLECMKLDGILASTRSFNNETIRAAFSGMTLPSILSNVANKKLLQGYQERPAIATHLCTTGDLNDYIKSEQFRLTNVDDLFSITSDSGIKDDNLINETVMKQFDICDEKFCFTREMVINDDLRTFANFPTVMGNRAAQLVDQMFFSRLVKNPLYMDGKNIFHSSHKNLLTGLESILSADSLKKAIQLFQDQVDAEGNPINVKPKFLLVPTSLESLANKLTQSSVPIIAGSDNQVRPVSNAVTNENLQVISTSYLTNFSFIGSSSTAWYLFGMPGQVDAFKIMYLNDKRTPTVVHHETDFNTLKMQFQIYFYLDVCEQDYRGMIKANGTDN